MRWRQMREGGGVQEYECACIFKAVFLLQEEKHTHIHTHSSLTGKRMGPAADEGMQMQF